MPFQFAHFERSISLCVNTKYRAPRPELDLCGHMAYVAPWPSTLISSCEAGSALESTQKQWMSHINIRTSRGSKKREILHSHSPFSSWHSRSEVEPSYATTALWERSIQLVSVSSLEINMPVFAIDRRGCTGSCHTYSLYEECHYASGELPQFLH